MFMLKIILFVLGITFTVFGYLIVFKKQYGLINDFEARKRAGSKKIQMRFELGKLS